MTFIAEALSLSCNRLFVIISQVPHVYTASLCIVFQYTIYDFYPLSASAFQKAAKHAIFYSARSVAAFQVFLTDSLSLSLPISLSPLNATVHKISLLPLQYARIL
jgi:hypothetical protein